MDPLVGGFVAAVAAWGSVVLVARVPLDRWVPPQVMRRVGGASLALLAATLLGATMPAWLPLAFLGGGLAVASWGERERTP